MNNTLKINIIETTVDGIDKSYCTYIPHEHVFKHGLIGSVIVGEVEKSDSGEIDLQNNFKANSLFKKTIFDFVEKVVVSDPLLIKSAKEQDEGWLYVIDQRTPTPNGEVPPFDIIGTFEVIDGVLDSFNSNENYQIRSINGFTDFGVTLNTKMNDFLLALLQDNA